jgi:UDP-N-acetylmuramoyl-L-alanyl-D-glutamate--2,6-diaminopimelate ligase
MRLSSLLSFGADATGLIQYDGAPDAVEITAITADSRAVKPGTLFAGLPGVKADGASFVAQAVAKGAAAVLVGSHSVVVPTSVPVLRSADPRRALALLAARFSGAQPAVNVAITGTNGKTSVAEFTRKLYTTLGRRAASLGTIGLVKPDGGIYGSLTTPDPVSLHASLAELAAEGVTHLAFEASSHGLDQRRLDGVQLKAAAFTNLGRDHLDYHSTVEEYFHAKLRLFDTLLPTDGTAVVHIDDERGAAVVAAARKRGIKVLTTGINGDDLRLVEHTPDGFAQRLTIEHAGKRHHIRIGMIGDYQATNTLLAAGLAIATGEDATKAIAAIASLTGVNGRLDIIGEHNGGLVVVDYAHKPEALSAALAALRPFATGKLICVFGCGGDRDKGKRPIMGAIATRQADVVIVTDDNPRTEVASTIRAEVLAGVRSVAAAAQSAHEVGAHEIGDRAEAIGAAVAMMGTGDVVLIAGKGHESGEIIGSTVIPFSDHDAAREAMGLKV